MLGLGGWEMRGIHAGVWSLQSPGGGGEPIHRQGLNQQRAEGPVAPAQRSLLPSR